MKARTPTSTLKPPFTTPDDHARDGALFANAASSDDQSLGRSTRTFERS